MRSCWRAAGASCGFAGAALAPGLLLLALWKQRGLGQLPLFASGGAGDHALAAIGVPLPSDPLASISRYVHIDWTHLRQNRDSLREFFWAVRPLEWVPIAGLLALGRRSWPKAVLVTGWFVAFLIVKGTATDSNVEDASFFRLMMPSFPAFVLLLAVDPAAGTEARRDDRRPLPACDRHHAGAGRAIVAVRCALRPDPPGRPRGNPGPGRPEDGEKRRPAHEHSGQRGASALGPAGGRAHELSWTAPYHGPVGVFYTILRSRPSTRIRPTPTSGPCSRASRAGRG